MEKTSFLELVNKRYSVREYVDKSVEKEKILQCLEAARLAPSACNSQPWKFIIIDDTGFKDNFCDEVFSGIYRTNIFAKKAPVIVAIVSEKGNFTAKMGNFIKDTRYYLIDLGIAGEHFALQAAELGLGACWLGWFDEKKAKKMLKIPSGKRIDILLSVGYPAGAAREKRRKDLKDIFETADKIILENR